MGWTRPDGLSDDGKREGEACALSQSIALGPDEAAVRFDDALANYKAEAGAGSARPAIIVGDGGKFAEEAMQAVGGKAGAVVSNGDGDMIVFVSARCAYDIRGAVSIS